MAVLAVRRGNCWLTSTSTGGSPSSRSLPRPRRPIARLTCKRLWRSSSNPLTNGLLPLDADVVWHGFHLQFPRWIGDSPDFEPPLPGFCEASIAIQLEVQPAVTSLIQSIKGGPGQHSVAWTMTNAFIGMYQQVIRILQRQMKAKPPPPANQIAAMQAEIQQAQQEVSVLTKFLQTLP